MLKLVESRLNQEKETIVSQQQSQNLLLTNLQAIQVILFLSASDCHIFTSTKLTFSVLLGDSGALRGRHTSASEQPVRETGARDLAAAEEA